MADEKKPPASDKNTTDKPADKPATEKPSASEKKAAVPDKKAAPGKKTAPAKKAEPKATDALSDKEKRAATTILKKKMSIEEEKRALDAIITGASTAEDKKKAIDELKKLHIADDIIKKRGHETPEGVNEIKQKAASAAKHAWTTVPSKRSRSQMKSPWWMERSVSAAASAFSSVQRPP